HTVSVLAFGGFFLRWLSEPRFRLPPREWVEGAIVIGLIALLSYLMAWTAHGSIGNISLGYVVIIPPIWASLRLGCRRATPSLALLSMIISSGIIFGHGPLSHTASAAQALFGIQVLVGVLSLIFLLFSSVTEERRDAVQRLETHVGALETSLEKISLEDQAKT